MTSFCVILTTTDSQQVADKIAKLLITKKIAGCIQIDSVSSYYEFENQLEIAQEKRLMIKALSKNYREIEQLIVQNHNYQLPQIVKIDINDGMEKYLKWLAK